MSNIENYKLPDIREWLAGFINAEFVLTDSFHGMVFSIIFRKPFYAIVNEGRGGARFSSIATTLGVEKNIIKLNDLENSLTNVYDNSFSSDKILERAKKQSMDF